MPTLSLLTLDYPSAFLMGPWQFQLWAEQDMTKGWRIQYHFMESNQQSKGLNHCATTAGQTYIP